MNVTDSPLLPVGSHVSNNTISAATVISVPPTTANTGSASIIVMQAITQNVRYKLDGTAATTTTGFQLKAGDPPRAIAVRPGSTISVIEETATAVLQYQFFRTADTVR